VTNEIQYLDVVSAIEAMAAWCSLWPRQQANALVIADRFDVDACPSRQGSDQQPLSSVSEFHFKNSLAPVVDTDCSVWLQEEARASQRQSQRRLCRTATGRALTGRQEFVLREEVLGLSRSSCSGRCLTGDGASTNITSHMPTIYRP